MAISRKTPLYVFLGAFFWFVAAMVIRYSGTTIFYEGSTWLIVLFAGTLPAGWLFIKLALAIGGVKSNDALSPVAIMCATGMILDGIAISQSPALYGEPRSQVMLGAAWLLWGVGVLITMALYMQSKGRPS
jgi:hypothetical protein